MAQLDHINIVVASLDRSVRFYELILGLQQGFRGTLQGDWIDRVTGLVGVEALCVFMESPAVPVRLELLQYVNPPGSTDNLQGQPHRGGARHIAFLVPDLDRFYDQARSNGIEFISPPVVVPFLLPGGRRKRLCYFYDPDGVLLEAAEYRDT